MKLKSKYSVAVALLLSFMVSSQIEEYNYKRNIEKPTDTWHSLTLPNAVFSKVKPNLADFRIYGITAKNDTIEAPYILKTNKERIVNKDILFQTINKTKTEEGYFFTFKLNASESINFIKLNFENSNFDWKVNLEGSQNQSEWFTVLEDYRILAIKNTNTKFKYTNLSFPKTEYRYFRLFVKSKTKPNLISASISKREVTQGIYNRYDVVKTSFNQDKAEKTTVVNFELYSKVPVNTINIDVATKTDYYRPLKIEYLTDSIQTEKGWRYNYRNLKRSTLHSLEEKNFKFETAIAKKFRITIYNNDNQPLKINSVSAKGYKYGLVARFNETAYYALFYGNTSARKPIYDIAKFKENIPNNAALLNLEDEEIIEKEAIDKAKPLFENEYWLWGIMIAVILLLGGFTLKMMNKKEA